MAKGTAQTARNLHSNRSQTVITESAHRQRSDRVPVGSQHHTRRHSHQTALTPDGAHTRRHSPPKGAHATDAAPGASASAFLRLLSGTGSSRASISDPAANLLLSRGPPSPSPIGEADVRGLPHLSPRGARDWLAFDLAG